MRSGVGETQSQKEAGASAEAAGVECSGPVLVGCLRPRVRLTALWPLEDLGDQSLEEQAPARQGSRDQHWGLVTCSSDRGH